MVQACLFAKITLQTQAEYFYAGTAETLKKSLRNPERAPDAGEEGNRNLRPAGHGRRPAGDRLGGAVDFVV